MPSKNSFKYSFVHVVTIFISCSYSCFDAVHIDHGGTLLYKEMCNFMIPHYMNDWKLVGTNLAVPKAWLDAIEDQRLNKADKCCHEMLAKWLESDLYATMEKLEVAVQAVVEPTASPSQSIVDFKKYLHQRYADMHVESRTNIAFIRHQCSIMTNESVGTVAKAMYHGNIYADDDQYNNQQLFSEPSDYTDYYSECIKSTNILKLLTELTRSDSVSAHDKPFLLLIEGAKGTGKTSICKEIAFQCAKQQGLHGQLTFLLCLNELNSKNINSLETFFKCVCGETQPTTFQNLSKVLQSSRGDKVMVIIDGYEKLFDQQNNCINSFIHKIINREEFEFQQSSLVISSCHTASLRLYKRDNCTRIELLGFTEEAKQQYIKCTLNPNGKSTTEIDKLTAYLGKHRSLNSLCYYPLCLKELVNFFQHLQLLAKPMPVHETEIINIITNRIVMCSLKSQEQNFLPLTAVFDKMSKDNKFTLQIIGKLAFYALQTKDCIFKLSDIKSGVSAADVKKCCFNELGILKVVNSFQNTDVNQMLFTFLHVTLQEFLAAFYVSTLSRSMCVQIWEKTLWKNEYLNVWAYYCGITKNNDILTSMLFGWRSWLLGIQSLPDEVSKNKIKCLYLVYCLMESPDNVIYQKAKPQVICDDVILNLSSLNLAEEDFNAVLLFLSCYKVQQWKCLNLSHCCMDDDKLTCCFKKLQSFVKKMPKIDALNLCSNELSNLSLHNVFKIAVIFNTNDIILSYNNIGDKILCQTIISLMENSVDYFRTNIIQNNKSLFLLNSSNLLQNVYQTSGITHLHIVKCSLQNDAMDGLLNALNAHDTLSFVFFYENELLSDDLVKIHDGLKDKNFLILEKMSLDIHLSKTNFKVILYCTNALSAKGLCNYPSFVLLQLKNSHINDEIMNKIAVILNTSSQQWNLLDLSGFEVSDKNLEVLCNALDTACKEVFSIKLMDNQLTSLSLITQICVHLNPKLVDISDNNIMVDDGEVLALTECLSTHNRLTPLLLTCNEDNVMICHKLDQTLEDVRFKDGLKFTYLFLTGCIVNKAFLKNALQNFSSIKLLHLQKIDWTGDYLYCFDEFKKWWYHCTLSICDSNLSDTIIQDVMNFVDTNDEVSIVLSTDNTILAHNCNCEVAKWHLAQNVSFQSLKLMHICKCSLKDEVIDHYLIENYFNNKKHISEIVLCKNNLKSKQVRKIIDFISQKSAIKVFFGEDSLNCNYEINKLSDISTMLVGSKMIIGKNATEKQVIRASSSISSSTLVIRMIDCNFTGKSFELLVSTLTVCDKIQEFTFCRSNLNDIWGSKILKALQNTITISKLLITSDNLTTEGVDSVATAFALVISSNKSLERLSIVFNILPTTASSKMLKAISEVTSLKQLCYYNSENCANELATAINFNPRIEELRLNNNFIQTDDAIRISVAINQLSNLKVLSLSNVGISKSFAINLATAINNKQLESLHLGSNNLQPDGITAIAEMLTELRTLRNLIVNNNGITEQGAESLGTLINSNKHLKELHLSNNSLKTSGMNKISDVLKDFTTLKVLNLKCNELDSAVADGIAAVITCNQLLEVINLSDNSLQTVGVIKVAVAIKSIHNLRSLDLSKNYITEEAADDISAAIACNTELEKLIIDDNALKSSGVATICVGIVKHISNLKKLRISNNYVDVKAADNISEVIFHNRLLNVIDVGDNGLLSEGVKRVCSALEKIHHIRELHLNTNSITEEAADDIAAAIFNNMQLKKFNLDNNHLKSTGLSKIYVALKQISTLRVFLVGNTGLNKNSATDLADVITNNPLLEHVGLGNNQLEAEGVKIVANALKQIHNLELLSLDYNQITEEAACDIALVINSNTRLEKLWLDNNSLGTKGIQIICHSLKQINTLKSLQLENNKITKEAAKDIADVIINNPLLETMFIGINNIQSFGIKIITSALSGSKKLKALSLKDNGITDEAANEIAAAIASNSSLEYLRLQCNYFKDEGVRLVFRKLKQLTALRVLYFGDVVITEPAASDMAEMLAKNQLLEKFCLNNCKLQEHEIICHSLSKIHHLKKLDLSDNHLGAQAADKISEVILSNRKLEYIKLSNNDMNDLGAAKISSAIKEINALKLFHMSGNGITEKAADNIAQVILNNPLLQDINLGNNNLQTTGIIKLAGVLKGLRYLENLVLTDNKITEKAASEISMIIFSNPQLKRLLLNDNFLKANGTKSICKSLAKLTALKHLDLGNNFITEAAADDIANVIIHNPLLHGIHLGNNNLKTMGMIKVASALKELHHLEMMTLSSNQITEAAADEIALIISNNTQLKLLLLNNNFLQTKGIKTICNSLSKVTALMLLHLENNFITEEAADNIAEVIINNPSLNFIHLGCNNLCTSGVIKVAGALKLLKYLRVLALNGNQITEAAADDIAQVISNNGQLETVILDDNNFKTSGIKVLCNSLTKCRALKVLYLKNNSITEEATDDIAALINCNQLLQSISVSDNRLGSTGIVKLARALSSLSSLRRLDFSSNEITDNAADYLAKVIVCNNKLEELWLKNNLFSTVGIHKICSSLKCNVTLKALDFENNKITQEAAEELAAVIVKNPLLKYFNINNCSLKAKAMKKVTNALLQLNSLEMLNIESSEVFPKGADGIAAVIKTNLSLQTVSLRNNKLQTIGVIKLMNALKELVQLKVLDLRENCITEEAADNIAEVITSNSRLQILLLDNNYIKPNGMKTICKSLMKISTLKVLGLSNNEITGAVDFVIAVIMANPLLDSLAIDIGKLKACDVTKITHALKCLYKMKVLKFIGKFNQITEEASTNIAQAIYNSNQFELLEISNCLNHSTAVRIVQSCKEICSLTVLDFSSNNIEDEIFSNLKDIISSNNCLKVLHLHNNSFTSAGGKIIATSLQYLKHLKVLSIDQNILSADVAYQMVNSIFTTRRAIIFIYKQSIIEESICFYCCLHKIKSLLFCKTFATINVESISVNVSDCGEAQVHWSKDNAISTSGTLQIIKSLQNVTTVKVSDSQLQFTEQEVNNIAAILSRSAKLENVWFGKHMPQPEIPLSYKIFSNVAVSLNTAYPMHQSYAISNISRKLICAVKSKNLVTLDLSGNAITEELLEDIQDVLASSTKLETLLLKDCTSIPPELLNAINCSNLKMLDLSRNSFVKDAVEQVASLLIKSIKLETYILEEAKALTISQQLLAIKSRNLKVLNLSNNYFTTEATLQLVTLLQRCTKLETLSLKFCFIESIDKVVANLNNINSLNELNLSWCNIRPLSYSGNMLTLKTYTVKYNAIINVIKHNKQLQKLNLMGSFMSKNFQKLADAISSLSDLKLLHIDHQIMCENSELVNSLICKNKLIQKQIIVTNYSLPYMPQADMDINTPSKEVKLLHIVRISSNECDLYNMSVTVKVQENFIAVYCFKDNGLTSTGILGIIKAFTGFTSLQLLHSNLTDYSVTDINEVVSLVNRFLQLEELVVSLNNPQSLALLCQAFSSTISKLKVLRIPFYKVHAGRNDYLIELLENNAKLRTIDLQFCLLNSCNLGTVLDTLKIYTTLESLTLRSSNISNKCNVANKIAKVLLRNYFIKSFDIYDNRLKADGIAIIMEGLKKLTSLKTLSFGNNNVCDDISDYMIDVINNNPKLKIFKLQYTCVHADGAIKMIRALESLSCLKILDISGNNINEVAADNIATVIINNSKLEELYISDNYLGITGVTKIAKALVNLGGLKVLDLINNKLVHQVAENVANFIENSPLLESLLLGDYSKLGSSNSKQLIRKESDVLFIEFTSGLFLKQQMQQIRRKTKIHNKYFSIHPAAKSFLRTGLCCLKICSNYNKLCSDGAKRISRALATIRSLEVLSIENNDVDDEAVDDIATALANNGIKQLWIGQNKFTSCGISTMLKALMKKTISSGLIPKYNRKPSLEVLDLNHSNLSLNVVDDISAVLSKDYGIKQFWLEGNNLSSQGISTIANVIKECKKICVLDLRDNEIKQDVADVLSKAIAHKYELQHLYLGNNQLENRGVKKTTEALNTTHGLLTLDLMNNNISEAAADALVSVITSCRLLEQLYLGDNKLHSTGTIKIASAIQQADCRSTLRVLDLSNNRIGNDERVTDKISRAVGSTELLTVLILDDNTLSVDGLLKITRSLSQSESAEYMMIFSVMHNGVKISEEAKDEMRAVMADQQLTDCIMYF